MAARKNLIQLAQTREKIRPTMLINRLQYFVSGKCTMTPSQVDAARLVLDETLPDLKPVKVEYDSALSYMDAIRASHHDPDDNTGSPTAYNFLWLPRCSTWRSSRKAICGVCSDYPLLH